MIGKYKTWAVFGLAALGLIAPQLGLSWLVNVLALGTAAMQGLTIGSYLTKYGKSDKMTQTLEVPTVVDHIIPDELKIPGATKTKTKNKRPVPVETDVTLEELRQMSEFLHQEQQNRRHHSEPKAKVFQKTDTNNNQ